MNTEEIWKSVIGYENAYLISNFGNLKSVDRKVKHNFGGYALKKGQSLKQSKDKDGYLFVNLKREQIGKSSRVHRLVAIAFLPNTENKPHVNHINGIKDDNRLENLEWNTLSENRQHAYDTGLQNAKSREGVNCNFNKLKEVDVLYIRSIYKKGIVTHKELSLNFNVTESAIQSIISRRTWKHL